MDGARKSQAIVRARTCYGHLAGRLGVALFEALVARGGLLEPSATPGPAALGSDAEELFGTLGIELAALRRERRRFATACLDWTERRPHLGGGLGVAVATACLERGWVLRQPGTRAVVVTEAGRLGLREWCGVEIEEAGA